MDDFNKLTYQTFRNMQQRFAEKRDKNKKLIRRGRSLPFDLEQLRAFVRGLCLENETTCSYCKKPLALKRVQWDHKIPISRGGTLELENLCPSCGDCNNVKGALTPSEFRALMEGLRTFPEPARRDILGRLRGKFRFLRPFKNKTEAKADGAGSGI